MKRILSNKITSVCAFFLAFFLITSTGLAQTDTTQVIQRDTVVQAAATDPPKEKKKKKNSIKLYAGVNINSLAIADVPFTSESDLGFDLGVAYKKGGFFYWEIGARFNRASYTLNGVDTTSTHHGSFGVSNIDIPITGGINFLSVTSRFVGLRVFLSAVPSFNIGVDGDETDISKDDINSFIFNGTAGLGVDVAFFFLEAGVQFGFNDLIKEFSSKPSQVFVNLGFRF